MVGIAVSRSRGLARMLAGIFVAASLLLCTGAWSKERSALDEIKQRGILKVAVYKNFAPFSHDGRGADVDLAEALAAKLGVKTSFLWFDADENMEDDLRNMVWKGHYLGFGPADVMMHVPVDREYMAKVDKVSFFAPYHRERYALARRLAKIPDLENFDVFQKQPLALEGDSLVASVMLSADSGRYRNQLKIGRTASEAIALLKSGTVDAAMAQQGELEGAVGGDPAYAIELPPHPVLQKRQWSIGLAVKSGSKPLAEALQMAINELMADGSLNRIMQKHGVQHRAP